MTILQTLLNPDHDRGSDFGPKVLRNRTSTPSGRVRTYILGVQKYYSGSVSYSPMLFAEYEDFRNLWDVCQQDDYGFLFWDHKENQLVSEAIGTGDGTNLVFQLVKNFTKAGVTTQRTIRRPVHGYTGTETPDGITLSAQAVSLVDQNTGLTFDPSTYDVDNTTGIITFHGGHAPINLHVVLASCYFFVPCMFVDDKLDAEQTADNFYIKSLRLQEVVP